MESVGEGVEVTPLQPLVLSSPVHHHHHSSSTPSSTMLSTRPMEPVALINNIQPAQRQSPRPPSSRKPSGSGDLTPSPPAPQALAPSARSPSQLSFPHFQHDNAKAMPQTPPKQVCILRSLLH